MLKVGITGGIGSGKTTVCKVFETLGIPVYYADDRAKALMVEHPDIINAIKKNFGQAAYFENGELNRNYLSKIVFNNKNKLETLNSIVHPVVYMDGEEWHQKQANVPYTIKEAALHFESGGYRLMDKMITVFAPRELRLARVTKRDNVSPEMVEARMDKQMPENEKIEKADFVIYNDGQKMLIPQIHKIHQELIDFIKHSINSKQ